MPETFEEDFSPQVELGKKESDVRLNFGRHLISRKQKNENPKINPQHFSDSEIKNPSQKTFDI